MATATAALNLLNILALVTIAFGAFIVLSRT